MASLDGPHELPPALLTRPEMIAACRNRDFTSVFSLVKRHAGIYPARIAALCGMTPSRVGEIMSGQRGLAHIDVIERVADGLRIPGAMLGLAQRHWEIPPPAVVSAPEPPPSPAPPPPRQVADLAEILHSAQAEQVTRSTLAAMRSSIEGYWRQDDQHGGAALRPAVVGQLRYAQQLIAGTHKGPLRRDLVEVAAELARLAGWAYFDARQYSTARGYFTQALHLAQDLTDRQFTANVLSCMSLQATYEGDASEAAALAAAAQDTARGAAAPDLVMAMLYMREAFAHAMMRDHTECHRAIGKANTHFERADLACAPQWVRYFDETKLVVDTGIALAQLGEHGKAEPLIAEGLRRENHEQARGRAFHTFWLASTQLRNGALDQACATAGTALDLVTSVDSPRVATHVREFHQRLAGHAGEAPVVAFEARMRAAFA
ncbi:helix-turn-helix domain-containing protein [Streptacidiphilus anmyonensis]|uniref:helix-turn-helix domain-containing protein n=1 Tax=Streptacidiphilus anmyonensis TaxID=405782 RepID=UPI0005A68D2F|nr:helix-turn-helix domain-containing protein [Streptacidiphilus anmyonensis]